MCSVSLKDIVPWSLIFGIQNERHANELQNMTLVLLEVCLDSSICDFNNTKSSLWRRLWPLIHKNISIKDIDACIVKMMKDVLHEHPSFINLYQKELQARASVLKHLVANKDQSMEEM